MEINVQPVKVGNLAQMMKVNNDAKNKNITTKTILIRVLLCVKRKDSGLQNELDKNMFRFKFFNDCMRNKGNQTSVDT